MDYPYNRGEATVFIGCYVNIFNDNRADSAVQISQGNLIAVGFAILLRLRENEIYSAFYGQLVLSVR
jgi:hypothetical protein